MVVESSVICLVRKHEIRSYHLKRETSLCAVSPFFSPMKFAVWKQHTRVGTLIVATIYLQLIQNGYMFRSFTVFHCSHQHCVQPVASDVEVVGYL